MGIMAFGLRDGMSVTISAEGNDADKAVETIKKFLIGEQYFIKEDGNMANNEKKDGNVLMKPGISCRQIE